MGAHVHEDAGYAGPLGRLGVVGLRQWPERRRPFWITCKCLIRYEYFAHCANGLIAPDVHTGPFSRPRARVLPGCTCDVRERTWLWAQKSGQAGRTSLNR